MNIVHRATVLVIDSFGIGEAPDAEAFGDAGANTALHICEKAKKVEWQNLQNLGLGNAAGLLGTSLPGCPAAAEPAASWGVLQEVSPGKDTTTGHWELAGLELENPFFTFPPEYPSFPEELTSELTRRTGRGVIGNCAASGTAIIDELGAQHMQTGDLICYTSADSVFQIAAHEEIVPLEELYSICAIARELCDTYSLARVIARPFIGKPGDFSRTKNRRDFSLALPGETILEHLNKAGVNTVGVGKIGDIFNEKGLSESYHDKGNPACLERTKELLARKPAAGGEFLFVNLVDTDMIYGHRRDPQGYHDAVAAVDKKIPELIDLLGEDELLIITADHGCDPTFRGTDHTREYVPMLLYRKGAVPGSLGIRRGFYDLAASLADYFESGAFPKGASML